MLKTKNSRVLGGKSVGKIFKRIVDGIVFIIVAECFTSSPSLDRAMSLVLASSTMIQGCYRGKGHSFDPHPSRTFLPINMTQEFFFIGIIVVGVVSFTFFFEQRAVATESSMTRHSFLKRIHPKPAPSDVDDFLHSFFFPLFHFFSSIPSFLITKFFAMVYCLDLILMFRMTHN